MSTPLPSLTRCSTASIFLRARSICSVASIETASTRSSLPTISSAVRSSAVPSSAWVTITIIASLPLNVPVAHGDVVAGGAQLLRQLVHEYHRAVAAAGTADGDREIRLPLVHVERKGKLEQLAHALQEAAALLRGQHVRHDGRRGAGQRPQRVHEVRVGQAA